MAVEINFKREMTGAPEELVERLTAKLKDVGFGILTRIDLDKKIKEKLGQDMEQVIILGACNPKLAFEAYKISPEFTALLPCNVVLREVGPERFSVEVAKPSFMLEVLGTPGLQDAAALADQALEGALRDA